MLFVPVTARAVGAPRPPRSPQLSSMGVRWGVGSLVTLTPGMYPACVDGKPRTHGRCVRVRRSQEHGRTGTSASPEKCTSIWEEQPSFTVCPSLSPARQGQKRGFGMTVMRGSHPGSSCRRRRLCGRAGRRMGPRHRERCAPPGRTAAGRELGHTPPAVPAPRVRCPL
jgi:hypothetical protein